MSFRYLFPIFMFPALSLYSNETQSPNVIVLYIDDMGIGDIGCYGGRFTPTPNIDRLAEDGLKLEQYYSAAPVSSPSRCAYMTGMYPIKHGINTFLSTRKHNSDCEQNDFLSADAPSVVKAFKNAGYVTAHIGKWHLGGGRDVKNAPSIKEYGYDEYISTYESPDPDPFITATDWIWSPQDSIKRWKRTEYFIDKSIDFIERHKDTPFFINLWPDDMHTPWVPESLADKSNTRKSEKAFIPVLAELDRQIGRLICSLENMGLTENTIIVFTSDNGPSPSFKSKRSSGYRGEKNSLYEAGIRMPFIIKYPKKIKPGTINSESVICSIDLYPSLCSMVGINMEQGISVDGQDFSDVLLGNSCRKRDGDLMWDFGRNEYFNFPKDGYHRSPHLAIRRGEWKLLVNSDGSDIQLYNLENDGFEENDIAENNKDIVKVLSRTVIDWYNSNK